MSALLLATASALALHAGPHARRSPPRRAAVRCCTAPPPPAGEGGGAPPEPTPSDAREALERAVAIDAEVLPPSYFESLRYDEDAVPWDLFGLPQAAVRNAAQSGAFGPRGTVILDCGCVCHRGSNPGLARPMTGLLLTRVRLALGRARATTRTGSRRTTGTRFSAST